MKKVSIITAFYKGNKYVENLVGIAERNDKKIKSLGGLELIIVNDSPEITVELPGCGYDVPVRVINHKKNSGIHQARVTGLKEAEGEYIIFLDQDDELSDDAALKLVKCAEDNCADVAVSNALIEQENGSAVPLYKNLRQFGKVLHIETFTKGHNQITSPGQCAVKRASIPSEWCGYIMETNGSDDLFLWVLLFCKGCKFAICDEKLYTHKYTGENLSASGAKMNTSSLSVVDFYKKIDYVPDKVVKDFFRGRQIGEELRNSAGFGKLKVYIKYADIMIFRAWWKLKGI